MPNPESICHRNETGFVLNEMQMNMNSSTDWTYSIEKEAVKKILS